MAHKLKLEINGKMVYCFINSKHRERFADKINNIPIGGEFQLTILKGKVLNWIDKVKTP